MNEQVATLKQALDASVQAHDVEKARLIAAGLNSKARYPMLKDLALAVSTANSAYVAAAHSAVRKELNKIIAADAPRRRAEKLARSPWKQAKAAAKAASKAE